MLYAILCYHDEAVVEGWTREEDAAVLAKRRVVQERLEAQGRLGPVVRLMPTTAATTVRSGAEPLVIDGPFAETKEQLLGFHIVECADLEEAVAAARELEAGEAGGSMEVRPIRLFHPGTPRRMTDPAWIDAAPDLPALRSAKRICQTKGEITMRFMLLRMADKKTEAGVMPSQELLAAMGRYMEEMSKAGVLLGGEGLKPSSTGARVRFARGKPIVTDGPFTESKELIGGYCLIEVPSRDEAIAWVKRWPVLDGDGEVVIEIRQLFEAEDFGEEFTPEMRQAEEEMRVKAAQRAKMK